MPSGKEHYRLRLADALHAHDTALKYGGVRGIVKIGSVQSAIARPYSGYYRPISRKAAALVESVCRNHGFADGNKRTCVLLLDLLLERSDYHLVPVEDEDIDDALELLTRSVADGQMSLEQIEEWAKARIKRKPAK